MTVTGVTVSLKINDTSYGRGGERFVSLRADADEAGGFEIQDFDGVLEQTLTLNLQAWEAIQASRYVGGEIKAAEVKELVQVGRDRTTRVLQFLKQRGTNVDSEPTEG
jgi:hypothetical protein